MNSKLLDFGIADMRRPIPAEPGASRPQRLSERGPRGRLDQRSLDSPFGGRKAGCPSGLRRRACLGFPGGGRSGAGVRGLRLCGSNSPSAGAAFCRVADPKPTAVRRPFFFGRSKSDARGLGVVRADLRFLGVSGFSSDRLRIFLRSSRDSPGLQTEVLIRRRTFVDAGATAVSFPASVSRSSALNWRPGAEVPSRDGGGRRRQVGGARPTGRFRSGC